MSDVSNPGPTKPVDTEVAPGIKSTDFVRYLAEKHKGVCPSCGTKKWTTGNLLPGQLSALTTYSAAPKIPSFEMAGAAFPVAFTPVVQLICGNCGFIELFSANYVQKWVEANK